VSGRGGGFPRRSRPAFEPGYGISEDREGMLDWSWAEERLATSRNYWIVTAGGDGAPAAAPVWGVWSDGALYFGTNPRSLKGRNLTRDPRVVIHLESGEEVVILRGEIEREDLPEAVVDAYEVKYAFRPPVTEGWFVLRPRHAVAWIELDYPKTATRFDFD
jgi:pyridoxamine 5'-phosphate oxidase-like protein